MSGDQGIEDAVSKYLQSHPGVLLHREAIAKETGLTETQVRSAMSRLANRRWYEERIQVVMQGKQWIFHPEGRQMMMPLPVTEVRIDQSDALHRAIQAIGTVEGVEVESPLTYRETARSDDGEQVLLQRSDGAHFVARRVFG